MPPLLADFIYNRVCKLKCEKSLTLPGQTVFSRILPFKMLLNSKLSLNKQNVAAGFEKTNSAATFCILFTYSPDVLTFSAHAVTSIKSAYPTSSGKIVTVCGTYVIINNTISSTPNCGSRSFT